VRGVRGDRAHPGRRRGGQPAALRAAGAARAQGEGVGVKTQAMLAVAHGSRDPRHREVIEGLVDAVREQRPELRVETAFLDHCGPTAARALHGLVRDGYQQVKVVPLLLNTAYHVRQDIPAAVSAAHGSLPRRWRTAVAKPVLTEPLGPHP